MVAEPCYDFKLPVHRFCGATGISVFKGSPRTEAVVGCRDRRERYCPESVNDFVFLDTELLDIGAWQG